MTGTADWRSRWRLLHGSICVNPTEFTNSKYNFRASMWGARQIGYGQSAVQAHAAHIARELLENPALGQPTCNDVTTVAGDGDSEDEEFHRAARARKKSSCSARQAGAAARCQANTAILGNAGGAVLVATFDSLAGAADSGAMPPASASASSPLGAAVLPAVTGAAADHSAATENCVVAAALLLPPSTPVVPELAEPVELGHRQRAAALAMAAAEAAEVPETAPAGSPVTLCHSTRRPESEPQQAGEETRVEQEEQEEQGGDGEEGRGVHGTTVYSPCDGEEGRGGHGQHREGMKAARLLAAAAARENRLQLGGCPVTVPAAATAVAAGAAAAAAAAAAALPRETLAAAPDASTAAATAAALRPAPRRPARKSTVPCGRPQRPAAARPRPRPSHARAVAVRQTGASSRLATRPVPTRGRSKQTQGQAQPVTLSQRRRLEQEIKQMKARAKADGAPLGGALRVDIMAKQKELVLVVTALAEQGRR